MEVKSAGVSEPYRSIVDHGIDVPMTKLPMIPCSKYLVIGNPKMRVARKRSRRQQVVWKVPRTHARSRRKRIVFRSMNGSDSNEFDRDTLYSDRRYDDEDMKIMPPIIHEDAKPKNVEILQEKKLIEICNREKTRTDTMGRKLPLPRKTSKREKTRVSFKLPPIEEKQIEVEENEVTSNKTVQEADGNGSGNEKHRHKSTCQSPDHKKICKGSPVCEGEAREFCDVLGHKYCSCCLAYHNRKKYERLMLPILRVSSPKNVTSTNLSRAMQKGAYNKRRSRKKSKEISTTCMCSKLPSLTGMLGKGSTAG
ncbi:uncharacterized protein LOC102807309 [Saccoglossus kowalevskii]|uniref:Uncharacterized protein LOC102807309 n=1 Tax=Saccoglossus kowalevskii TaxID=10224 RepID=A0ABM0N0D5_SACKO|nr:PREDICTED: uncharacterized protein LOC102807309 [Saccoglossus kowalevskii]